MALFKRKDSVAGIEREVADFERRRARLADQLQHSEAELTAAVTERRKQMVETDQDNGADGRGEINKLRDRVAELGEAIGEIDNRITAAKVRLAAEHEMVKRRAEAEARTKQAEALEAARDAYSSALAQLIAALEPAAGASLLANAAITSLAASRAGVGPGLEAVVQELRQYAHAVVEGGAPRRPQPAPVEPPPKPTPIERKSVTLLVPGKWLDQGEIRTGGKLTDHALPSDVADKAIEFGYADPPCSPRVLRMREVEGPDYAQQPEANCIDLMQPRPTPQLPGEPATAAALPVHSEFIPTRGRAVVGTATAHRAR